MRDCSKVFFTIGYQHYTVPSILRTLRRNRVTLLVDVRQNPVSRKRGFSRRRLGTELRANGINYAHYPCLGTPSAIRERYCRTRDVAGALRAYATYLAGKEKCLQSLIELAREERFCLLCLESEASLCHRFVIAEKLKAMTRCHPVHLK